MTSLGILALLVFSTVCNVNGGNVLMLSPLTSPSHHIFNKALAIELSTKGHNVTMVGSDVEKYSSKNFHYIYLDGVYENLEGDNFNINDWLEINPVLSIVQIYEFGKIFCELVFGSQGFKELLAYPKDFKFDVIIFDVTSCQCLYGLIDRFGSPPAVGITAFVLPPNMVEPLGGHIYPSYSPHYSLQYTEKMNFMQRLVNFLLTRFDLFYREFIYEKTQTKMIRQQFGEQSKSMSEYERTMAILLGNNDLILGPTALPPNIISVGGMHIKEPKSLPEDIEKIASKGDFIFFSLGSNILSSKLTDSVKQEFLAAFSKLSVNILWKYEAELPNLPPNVYIRQWLPQNDILGHKNCKLFMTHAGALSTQEALYHGVPVIGIPGFMDQHRNIKKFVDKGLGLQLSFSNIQRDLVYETIQEVLINKTYSNNMRVLSAKYKDQPQTPLNRATFWVEYVMRHKGAKELELPVRHMCFIVTTNLDVVTFIFGCIFLTLYMVYKIVKCLCCKTSATQKQKVKQH